MKLRQGFVSNSSTSSFLMFGICAEGEELLQALKENGVIEDDSITDLFDWEWDTRTLENKGFDLESPYDGECGMYVGKSWSKVGDDQTGSQFKEQVQNEIQELFGSNFTL